MTGWIFHKTRNDYTFSSQKGNIKIWANVSPDCLAVSLSEISEDSELGDFSYGKFLQVTDLESAMKFIDSLVQDMPSNTLEECSIYVVNKLGSYGKDNETL